MRKIYFLILVTLLILVGCSNDSLHFKGESEHWKGEYTTNVDGTTENGQFEFEFKDGKQKKKNLEINVDGLTGGSNRKESENDETVITMKTSCSGCSVTRDSDVFKVTIKWDGNEESFELK
ncbi:hypothetical protein [Bacillus sp. AFS088145]|uniref:hypothetical protein n=1 Tax=Bacillus sp. AFS088145 TaxID=2033514 RepID=UPI000BF65109|nr:hypothetical protein [Bacillus sp. AFS088145]PFH87773.1 hypothetical protein COI44_09200 [Bacillus sp. AFS088145]